MTSPSNEPSGLDKENLLRGIVDMSKELRDQAVGNHHNDTCYIQWEFSNDSDSAYTLEYQPVTTNYKENGGIPDNWDDSALENLYKGLTDGRVRALALDKEKQILGESNARDPATNSTTRKPRLPGRLRDRLIETIETAIGRPINPRSAKIIDPRKSDPKAPNLYKWQFSSDYAGFPDKKGGISRWSAINIQACYEALDKKHLIVVNVAPGSSEAVKVEAETEAEAADVDMDSSEQEMSSILRVVVSSVIERSPSLDRTPIDKNGIHRITKEVPDTSKSASDPMAVATEEAPIKLPVAPFKGLEVFQSQILNLLSTALEDQAKELELTWKTCQASKRNEIRTALRNAEQQYEAEREAHQKTLSNLLPLQREGEKLRTKVAQIERDFEGSFKNSQTENKKVRAKLMQLEQNFDRKVSAARNEAGQSMRDEILRDLDQTMEGERLALRRYHMEQLVTAREDSYELGLMAARKEANSNDTQMSSIEANTDPESLKRKHEEDLLLARKAGRESAYVELSLGSEPTLNDILQSQVELNSNGKIHELKMMHQNWHDIPQRILPSYMLPEGHTPNNKTLHLLAKLSKEVDGITASRMLAEEIDQRCKNNFDHPKSRIVTDTDIQKVLDRNTPNSTSRSTIQGSVDDSQAPQPLRSHLTVPERDLEAPNDESPDRSQRTINYHNGEYPALKGKFTFQSDPTTTAAFGTPTHKRNTLATSTLPFLGSLSNPPKRPNTDSGDLASRDPKRRKTYTPGAIPARLQEIHRPEETGDSSVEVDASTIFMDSYKKVKDAPDLTEEEAAENENLYDASPPRRTRRRAGSKKGDGA